MKLKYISGILAIAAALAFSSCQKEAITGGDIDGLSVSTSYVALPADGKETVLEINAAGDWTINVPESASWLSVTPTKGGAGVTRVTFTAPESQACNKATLTIDFNGKTQYIYVTQGTAVISDATCKEILDGPDGKTYRVTGTVTRITETATYGNWYIADETGEVYIYGTKYEGATKQAALIKLGIDVGDVVTIEGPKTTYNGTVELVDVDVLKVVKSMVKVIGADKIQPLDAEGASFSVDVIAKAGSLSVEADQDWLLLASTKVKKAAGKDPVDTTVVTFRALANEGDVRTATVTVSSGTSTIDFEVSQKSGLAAYPLPYEETFTSGNLGAWEINNINVADAKNATVWAAAGDYGAKASAGQKCVSEAEIVSPLVDLGKVSAATLSFEHCHKYAGNVYEEFTLWASGDNGATWDQLLIPHYGTNVDYNYVSSGSISLNAYAGKQVLVKFVYKSNMDFYGTWEIKNLKIVEGNGTLGSVAEIASLGWNKDVKTDFEATLTDALVTYVNGNNCFVEDVTGGMLLYKSGHGLEVGDKISGKVTGVMTFYGGFAEATDLNVSEATVTKGATVAPTVITVDKLLASFNRYVSCMVKLEGVTFDKELVDNGNRNAVLTQGSSTIALYAKVKTGIAVAAGASGDVVCFPCYNSSVANKQVGFWTNTHLTVK
ncbi:MAG: BACON domain-containing protein [Bacteroidales bacterium]|nr:BACON domain-containing protein [Bacteroidales bacterium]